VVLDPFEYRLVSTPSPDPATSRSQGGVEWGLLCDCLFGGVERNKGSSGENRIVFNALCAVSDFGEG
jgi:hypothetical protein